MANGRPRDGDLVAPPAGRSQRLANAGGLEALGKQVGGGARSLGDSGPTPGGQRTWPAPARRPDRCRWTGRAWPSRRRWRRRRSRRARWAGRGPQEVEPAAQGGDRAVVAVGLCRRWWPRRGTAITSTSSARSRRRPAASCATAANGAPYNVLADRLGHPGPARRRPRPSSSVTRPMPGGQRSDTIKIIHVDPQTGTASTLSIPRDTFVTLSGVPSSSGVSNPEQDQLGLRQRSERQGPERHRAPTVWSGPLRTRSASRSATGSSSTSSA